LFWLLLHVQSAAPTSYLTSPTAQAAAAAKLSRPVLKPPLYTVDLDEPAATRWSHVAADYRNRSSVLIAYLDSVVPKWLVPVIETVLARLRPHFHEYGQEMDAWTQALGLKMGDIVVLNLIMQLESLGLNCSNWNNTGPTVPDDPGCKAVDPSQSWCYCHAAAAAGALPPSKVIDSLFGLPPSLERGPGLCTSVVSNSADGHPVLVRNLDWNLPPPVSALLFDVDFMSGGKRLFRATSAPGVVGVVNGQRDGRGHRAPGESGGSWAVSIDARGKGGKLLPNMLQLLLLDALTPTQHMRKVLETATSYDDAVDALSRSPQIDESYFIVAGASAEQGAVIARGREKAVDVWRLNSSEPDGWFRLQTNYDRWRPVPSADDRRTPGVASMRTLGGPDGVTSASMWGVITRFPVFNHHTDITVFMSPSSGVYNATVWQ